MAYSNAVFSETVRTHSRDIVIDDYLPEKLRSVLYERWDREWDEPLDFGAAGIGITCSMVLNAPLEAFQKAYGKRNAASLKKLAAQYTTGV